MIFIVCSSDSFKVCTVKVMSCCLDLLPSNDLILVCTKHWYDIKEMYFSHLKSDLLEAHNLAVCSRGPVLIS